MDQSLPARVKGVVAYNDEIAAALIAGALEAGISVPAGVAVIGVDNDPLGGFKSPPLTTIEQRHDVIAAHIAAIMDAGIKGDPSPHPLRSEALSIVEPGSA